MSHPSPLRSGRESAVAVSEPAPDGAPVPAGLDRRRFLTLGSAGVAALSLGPLAGSSAAAELDAAPLSVGYLDGSGELPSFDGLVWRPHLAGADPGRGPNATWASPYSWRVEPAHRLPMGDQDLAGATIEVRIHGLYPAPPEASWFEAAHLDVLFPLPGELVPVLGWGAPLPYFAWSLSARSAPSPSPPCCFRLPLEPDGGLELRLRVTPGSGLAPRRTAVARTAKTAKTAPAEEWRFATRFTVDWAAGMPRLHRGIYFLGLAPDTWRRPVQLPAPGAPERPDLCSVVLSVERVETEEE